jgi:hypothetical protein
MAVQYIDYFAVPRGPWAEVWTVEDLLLLLILCPGCSLRIKTCHQRDNGDRKERGLPGPAVPGFQNCKGAITAWSPPVYGSSCTTVSYCDGVALLCKLPVSSIMSMKRRSEL